MKQSYKAKRMARNHKRLVSSKLHLVSLMDIFTILVFFLMVNTSEVQVMQNNKTISLAKSTAQQVAQDNLVITVTTDNLLVQGHVISTIADVVNSDEEQITALVNELTYQQSKIAELNDEMLSQGLAINIMADKRVPYSTLKKILKTSASNGYSNISLAVSQLPISSTTPSARSNSVEDKV
jgi:biopolymer transport protein ExbD